MDNRIKIFWLVCLTSLFFTGTWLIDLGASAVALEASGVPVYAQTLSVAWSPNQIYHIGLIFVSLNWLVISVFLIFHIVPREKPNEEKKK